MRPWTRYLPTALLIAVAAGCSGITTNANIAPGANLAQYHTYGWYAPPRPGESPGEQQVRVALENQLAQKGLVPATNGRPDFLVAYHATRQQKVAVTPGYGYGYGYGYGLYSGMPSAYTYTEGTLIVDFIDPKTNQAFWRGTASGVLNHPNNPDPQKIDTAVAKLMKRYPVEVASVPQPVM